MNTFLENCIFSHQKRQKMNVNISKNDYDMDTEAVTMQAFGNLLMEIHDTTQNRVKDCFTN